MRLRILQREEIGTVTNGNVSLPQDCLQVLSLRLNKDDVEFVDDATWNAFSDSESVIGHTIGRVFNRTIELYPPSGSAYKLRYAYAPTPLEYPEDSPDLPVHLHSKLPNYAVAMCRYKEGQIQEGDRMMGVYEASLPEAPLGLLTLRPGPLSIGFAPGPWDSDPDTIHR
jgi:hypothetical protein